MRVGLLLAVAVGLAVPAFGRAEPPPVEDYGKLPAMDMVRLSPSGALYAFAAQDGEKRKLVIATTDKKPIFAVDIGAVKVIDIDWAGEDFVLVTVSQTENVGNIEFAVNKQELETVFVLNVRTHKVIRVFAGQTNVEGAVIGSYGAAQIKGRWYGFFGGFTLEAEGDGRGSFRRANMEEVGPDSFIVADLYRVDLETGVGAKVATGKTHNDNWLIGPRGDIIARSLYVNGAGTWRVMSGGPGERELASGRDPFGGPTLLGLGRTGDVMLISRQGPDGAIVEEIPLAGGPAKVAIDAKSPDYALEDPRSRLWVGAYAYGDETVETFFDPVAQSRWQGTRKAFPGHRVRLLSWSDDFNRMIVFTDGADDSGSYWFVDIGQHSADELGMAYPTIKEKDVGPVKMIDYKAADGLDLRGVLTLPPGRAAKNLPLVVMPHGGPWARDYPQFDYWAQAFASRGYAVFQPNFRGSTGYGDKLYDAGKGQWGRKMQTDISDGVAELARQGVVDPKRACIVGWSYGGYAALAGVTIQQGLYRCAVSMAGVSDLNAQFGYLEDKGGLESVGLGTWREFLGIQSRRDGLQDISPALRAARADAPILLIHGNDDTVVPIAQSDEMAAALARAGKPVERVTLKGADHWLLRQDTRVAMLKSSVAFVQKYDPPDPLPASGGR